MLNLVVCKVTARLEKVKGKMEGRIEVTGRRGRKRKHLTHDLNEKRDIGN
jgi:hypothetical protein